MSLRSSLAAYSRTLGPIPDGVLDQLIARLAYPLYSNPYFEDLVPVQDDAACRAAAETQWRWAQAEPESRRFRNRHLYILVTHLPIALLTLGWAVDGRFSESAIDIAFRIVLAVTGGLVLLHLAVRSLLTMRLRKWVKRLQRELDSTQDKVFQQSFLRYQAWLRELRDTDIAHYERIQNWHLQERVARATEQTAASSRDAATAARLAANAAMVTAFNTNVIRNNQKEPFKFLP